MFRLGGAAKNAFLVTKTDRAHPAGVIYREEEIDRLERHPVRLTSAGFRLHSPFGVVAQDDAPPPSIGFAVSKHTMKDRAPGHAFPIRRATHQRKLGCKHKPPGIGQPGRRINESGTLASTIRIEMKRPDMAGRLTEINL